MNQQFSIFGTIILRILGFWAIGHGILTCLNTFDHAERWSLPAYEIVAILPPWVWGSLLILGGSLILFASYKGANYSTKLLELNERTFNLTYDSIKNVGLWILATWFFTIAIGFTVAAINHGDVSLAAGSRDLFIGILCVMLTKSTEPPLEPKEDSVDDG